MKKIIALGTLCICVVLVFSAWKSNDKKSNSYSQQNLNSKFIINSFDQDRMRQHFKDTYNVTTEKVSFTVKDLKSLINNLDDNAKVDFFFGAYEQKDIERNIVKYQQYSSMIKDKATLLVRTKSESAKSAIMLDLGTICPPPDPCGDPSDPTSLPPQ